jgi:hypothetical protein
MSSLDVEFTTHNIKIKLANNELLFNKNILYFLNLETLETSQINSVSKLKDIYNKEKFLLFTCNYIGNYSILKEISSKLCLNFIEYSTKCFWSVIVINENFFEKINVNFKNFKIDYSNLQSKNAGYIISDNFFKGLKVLNEKIENYKQSILEDSLEKIKTKQNNINNYVIKIEEVLKNIKDNTDSINTLKDNKIINLVEQKEIIMKDIKYLERQEKLKKESFKKISLEYEMEKEKYEIMIQNKKNDYYSLMFKVDEIKNEVEEKILMSNITLSDNIERRPLAIMVHLFNITLWDDITIFLQNLEGIFFDIDLYVNISVNEKEELEKLEYSSLIEKINNNKLFNNIFITDSDNRGMDIGGFFISCCKMFDMGLKYDSIIKIHSKTNDSWRFAMLYALLGNDKIIRHNMELIKKKNIGMIGNNVLSINKILSVNQRSYKYIYTYMDYFKIKETTNLGHFVPGTIFWMKGDVLEIHFTKEIILKCYNEFEQNYCGSLVNNREGKPHAFERFFGVMVNNAGLKTVPFDHKV